MEAWSRISWSEWRRNGGSSAFSTVSGWRAAGGVSWSCRAAWRGRSSDGASSRAPICRALALEQAEETVANWFRAVLGSEVVGDGSPLLIGRAAFAICQAAGRWPGVLTTCDRLSLTTDAAMQQPALRAIPEELPGAMAEQALEPWSTQDLLSRLRSLASRWGRGFGGTTAAP